MPYVGRHYCEYCRTVWYDSDGSCNCEAGQGAYDFNNKQEGDDDDGEDS